MANEKKYCGKAKYQNTNFGDIIKLTLSPTDIETIVQNANNQGWCNVDILQMKNPDKRGNTMYAVINEYNSNNNNQTKTSNNQAVQETPYNGEYDSAEYDEIPF